MTEGNTLESYPRVVQAWLRPGENVRYTVRGVPRQEGSLPDISTDCQQWNFYVSDRSGNGSIELDEVEGVPLLCSEDVCKLFEPNSLEHDAARDAIKQWLPHINGEIERFSIFDRGEELQRKLNAQAKNIEKGPQKSYTFEASQLGCVSRSDETYMSTPVFMKSIITNGRMIWESATNVFDYLSDDNLHIVVSGEQQHVMSSCTREFNFEKSIPANELATKLREAAYVLGQAMERERTRQR